MNKQMQRTEQGGGTPHQMRRSIRRWIGAFRWTKKSVILTMLVLVLIIALVMDYLAAEKRRKALLASVQ